jgi:hypothetical protein
MSSYFCLPSDILTAQATLSLTGAEDPEFPLTNLQDGIAHTVFKSTGSAATIRATFGAAKTLQAIALIHHKLVGATITVTNTSGFSNGLAVAALPEDGHPLDPWKDYRGLANTTSTTWDVAITGAATVVAIAELLLIQTLRPIDFSRRASENEQHPTVPENIHRTDYGVRLPYEMGVRLRDKSGHVFLDQTLRNLLISLERDARGRSRPFLLIPDGTLNDAWLVNLMTPVTKILRENPGLSEIDLEFAECGKGLAL